jgi:DsbC/DsbD-like thiol-disulfide interchange protein
MRRSAPLAASALCALAAALAPAPDAAAAAGPWRENPQSRVRLITPYAVASPRGEIRLGLQVALAPGWHSYWKNSGDAGYPPAIDFAPTPEVRGAELFWPAPERYPLPGGLVAFGYEREVVYPIRARFDAAGASAVTLTADLDYLVCEVECVPYSYRLTVEQPIATRETADLAVPDPDTAPLFAAWLDRLPTPIEEAGGIATRGALDLADPERPALVVEVDGEGARRARRPDLFLEAHDLFTAGPPAATPTAGGLRFRVPLAYRERPRDPPAAATFAWTVTGLDGGDEGAEGTAGGRRGPAAVEARRTVGFESSTPSEEQGGAAPPARGASSTGSATAAASQGPPAPPLAARLRAWLEAPVLLAFLAVVAVALALRLFGLLGSAAGPAGGAAGARRREALGFVPLAAAVGLLYALAPRIGFERLAFVQLALLAGGLAAWLHRRAAGRRLRRAALALALLALAALVLWLARADSPAPFAGSDPSPRPAPRVASTL